MSKQKKKSTKGESTASNTTTVSIPKPLFDKVKQRIKGTGFNSVSSYITYLLRQVISRLEMEKESKDVFNQKDEEEIRKRLNALGYL